MNKVTWASLDPINGIINIYPKKIATKIEQAYLKREQYSINNVELGTDFFNATVHFPLCGEFYQTTPKVYLGRAGFKESGYRSVKRCELCDDIISLNTIQLHGGVWRIVNAPIDISSNHLTYTPSLNDIIYPDNLESETPVRPWTGNDLNSSDNEDTMVVIWQWSTKTDGDVTKYPENSWHPYNNLTNNDIEVAFQNNNDDVTINLAQIGDRIIIFNPNSCFARQTSLDRTRVRTVRRIVKTVKEVKEMLKEKKKGIDKNSSVPEEFNCPILQEIMKNPVTTVDGFTYEREAIERWFSTRVSSPLTGLDLCSNILVENKTLAEAIKKFESEITSN